MPRLRPARTRVLALFFLVRRRRLRRGARVLIGPLKPEHQLDQLVFAELLQISAIHSPMDSEIAPRGKGVSNYLSRDLDVQYKTAFVLAHKLREALAAEA